MNHHKNANGESLFIFEWQGGGGNKVYALDREEAIKKANAMHEALKVRENSLRTCTWQEYLDFDRSLYMMWI